MRRISDIFMDRLKTGFLSGITKATNKDDELDMEIRDNFIELYYKGHELLNLKENKPNEYRVKLHHKIKGDLDLPNVISDEKSSRKFTDAIRHIKQNIGSIEKRSIENEYEQLVIRANNYEPRNNSEYFIVDRQYKINKQCFDLLGIYCENGLRNVAPKVPMCLLEVKYALNPDIGKVHDQLQNYKSTIDEIIVDLAQECESIFRQKLDLGLYKQTTERINAMRKLRFSREKSQFKYILILIDYNPKSKSLKIDKINKLPFLNQIRIYKSGFALWDQNLKCLEEL